MLNNSAMIVEFDDMDKREVETAKEYYRKARQEGRIITDRDGNVISHFKSSLLGFVIKEKELKENEFAVRIFDETGDRRLIWDMTDPDQVKEASGLFKQYIDKGWRAYTVDEKGKSRRRILSFDLEKQEILFEEKPVKTIADNFVESIKNQTNEILESKRDKIDSFIKSFKNVKLVPRTFPG